MPDVIVLLLAASATALATGIGAIPVFLFGQRTERATPFLLGFAAGVMGVAALAGLLIPATEEGSLMEVAAGFAVGIAFLVVVSRRFKPDHGFMGHTGPGARTSALVFLVLFVHSLPEGLPIGTAFASDRAGLSLLVILAIGIQNVPEGTSVAIPMQVLVDGSLGQQFGSNLRQLRCRAQLSQIDLGAVSGVHRQRIGYMENGVQVPRLDSILKLSAGPMPLLASCSRACTGALAGMSKVGFELRRATAKSGSTP